MNEWNRERSIAVLLALIGVAYFVLGSGASVAAFVGALGWWRAGLLKRGSDE